jgi:hypothetical protein
MVGDDCVTPLESLRRQLADLTKERVGYVTAKKSYEAELVQITAEIRGNHNIPRDRWNKLLARQAESKRFLFATEQRLFALGPQIKKLNQMISELESTEYVAKRLVLQEQQAPDIVRRLSELREKYAAFGADNTRVSSMRLMATQFANELEALIRAAA